MKTYKITMSNPEATTILVAGLTLEKAQKGLQRMADVLKATMDDKALSFTDANFNCKYRVEEQAYKTIRDNQPVKLDYWKGNAEMAMIIDMGQKKDYKDMVTDENRVYAGARIMFLSNNPADYERQNREYANPLVLTAGEIVELEANNKRYRVIDMGRGKFKYYSDILQFELIDK